MASQQISSKVIKTTIPSGTLVGQAFPHIDYADAYRVLVPTDVRPDVISVTNAIFAHEARWIGALIRLRNFIVSIVGLKTETHAAQATPTYEPGSQAGIFRVYARGDDEILMGEDDRHLDFRVSVLVRPQGDKHWAIVSTVVRYNGWLGRVYFFFVAPMHRMIVHRLAQNLLYTSKLLTTNCILASSTWGITNFMFIVTGKADEYRGMGAQAPACATHEC